MRIQRKKTLQSAVQKHRKGFSETWISWIRQVVQTGKVCININGENGNFFRT